MVRLPQQHVSPSARTLLAFAATIWFAGLSALAWAYELPALLVAFVIGMMVTSAGLMLCCLIDVTRHDDEAMPELVKSAIRDAVNSRAFHAGLVSAFYRQPQPERRGHELHRDALGVLFTSHPADKCEGEGCPIHHPSDHPMAAMPFLSEGALITRRCPHDAVHPDPDSLGYIWRHVDTSNKYGWEWHTCCVEGCCGAPLPAEEPAAEHTGEHPGIVPTVVRESLDDAREAIAEMVAQHLRPRVVS